MAAAGILLAVFAALCAHGLRWDSPTVDEFAHLPAGYYYLKTGNFALYDLNPPLVRLVSALPLLAVRPHIDTAVRIVDNGWFPWVFATDFMRRNRAAYDAIFLLGRLPIVLLGVLLGLLVWRWARRLYGEAGGLLALYAYALCPSVVAHAHLATTDLGFALAVAGALFLCARWLDRPSPATLLAAGAGLGLAQLAKFSAVILYPVLLILAVAALLRGRRFPLLARVGGSRDGGGRGGASRSGERGGGGRADNMDGQADQRDGQVGRWGGPAGLREGSADHPEGSADDREGSADHRDGPAGHRQGHAGRSDEDADHRGGRAGRGDGRAGHRDEGAGHRGGPASHGGERVGDVASSLAALGVLWLISLLVLDAGYLFAGLGRPLAEAHFRSHLLQRLAALLPGRLPAPLPAAYLSGFDSIQLINEQGEFPTYLFGQWLPQGSWAYYPLTLLFKTPLPLIAAWLIAPFVRPFAAAARGGAAGAAPEGAAATVAAGHPGGAAVTPGSAPMMADTGGLAAGAASEGAAATVAAGHRGGAAVTAAGSAPVMADTGGLAAGAASEGAAATVAAGHRGGAAVTAPASAPAMAAAGGLAAGADGRLREAFLWLPALAMLAFFSLGSKVSYGIRYLLPILPLGCIYIGRLAPWLASLKGHPHHRPLRIWAVVALVLYPLSVLLATPNTLDYFNLLAGGQGDRVFLDSNLDWGQGLKRLRAHLDATHRPDIALAYFGHVDPEIYGIHWHFPSPDHPGPVVVSANFLHGYPYVTNLAGHMLPIPPNAFAWLARYPRLADLGGGLYLYEIPAAPH